jgi:hypothetical protein
MGRLATTHTHALANNWHGETVYAIQHRCQAQPELLLLEADMVRSMNHLAISLHHISDAPGKTMDSFLFCRERLASYKMQYGGNCSYFRGETRLLILDSVLFPSYSAQS